MFIVETGVLVETSKNTIVKKLRKGKIFVIFKTFKKFKEAWTIGVFYIFDTTKKFFLF